MSTLASNNPFPSVLVTEGTTPASPAAGKQRVFIDSADHHLKRVNSSGTVTDLEGSLAFKTIAVSGQSDVVADAAADTLTLVAGTNVTITTNAGSDSITIAASGGGGSGTVTHTGGALTSGKTVIGAGSDDVAVSTLTANLVASSSGTLAGATASASSKLLGSGASGSGSAYAEITLGTNLSMSGTTLNASGGGSGTTSIGVVNGRLTTETGVPVSTSDRTAQSTIYFTPYNGNQIGLYNGSGWTLSTFSELSLALSGLTSGKNYDVFVDYNSGTPQLVLSAAWSSDTARTDAIAKQDGISVKSGTPAYRLVGTIRTTGTTTTEDSGGGTSSQTGGKRFVWNLYNQVPRQLAVIDTTDNWTYNTATIRQANGASGNKVEWVTGGSDMLVIGQTVHGVAGVNNGGTPATGGVGIDSTTTLSGLTGIFTETSASASYGTIVGAYRGYPGLGYHYAAWLEKGGGTGTYGWRGDDGGAGVQSGLSVQIIN